MDKLKAMENIKKALNDFKKLKENVIEDLIIKLNSLGNEDVENVFFKLFDKQIDKEEIIKKLNNGEFNVDEVEKIKLEIDKLNASDNTEEDKEEKKENTEEEDKEKKEEKKENTDEEDKEKKEEKKENTEEEDKEEEKKENTDEEDKEEEKKENTEEEDKEKKDKEEKEEEEKKKENAKLQNTIKENQEINEEFAQKTIETFELILGQLNDLKKEIYDKFNNKKPQNMENLLKNSFKLMVKNEKNNAKYNKNALVKDFKKYINK